MIKYILYLVLSVFTLSSLNAQLLYNNNSNIFISNGAVVQVNGTAQNAGGTVENNGTLNIKTDYINDDITQGTGDYYVTVNWENNAVFTPQTSHVYLDGANQLITGSQVTSFYDLTILNAGIKTQTINARTLNVLDLTDRELATTASVMFVDNSNVNAIALTTGFVSSDPISGRLDRATNSTGTYLFPTGSSIGTARYRPIEITPTAAMANRYEVRFANVDANTEAYNRAQADSLVCLINPNWFHIINRTNGATDANVKIYYNQPTDGSWSGITQWNATPTQWEDMGAVIAGTPPPMESLTKMAWNDWTDEPYALSTTNPMFAVSGVDETSCGANDGQLIFTLLNANANYTVTYDSAGVAVGPINITTDGTGQAIINVGAGTYTNITVTNGTCSFTTAVSIVINGGILEDAAFSYAAASYCQTEPDPIPTITGTTGGLFTSTAGITLTAGTGEIDLSASTPGTYGVLYTTSTSSCKDTMTVYITIDPSEDATFSYTAISYCQTEPDPSPTITGTSGGAFTSTAGIILIAGTGEIDLSASTPGTYGVLYTTPGPNCQDTLTVSVTITTSEDAAFSYTASNYCTNGSNPTPTVTGTAGGTFTSTPAGLNITAGTGEINLATSTPGTYGVLYTTPSASCQDTLTVYVTIDPAEDATFSYTAISYCQTEPDPTPTITGTSGGAFTSTAGIILIAGTGEIDLSASTPGTYGVLYTTPGPNCQDTLTVSVTITTSEDAAFSYTASNYCANGSNPTPIITGTAGGTFTSTPTGLSITAGTGEINLATSTPGTYGVLYTTPSTSCQDTLTVYVTIDATDAATFNYTSPYCQTDPNPTPTITGTTGGLFTIDNSGTINASTGEIDLTASGLGTFNIKYLTSGLCPDSLTISITISACTMPIAGFTASDTAICEGECVTFTDISTGTTSWSWTFAGGTPATSTDQNPISCFNTVGTYVVEQTVTNSNGTDVATQTIVVSPMPTVIASPDVSINFGESTPLTATGSGGVYTWSPTDWLSCIVCQSTIASPEETTTYTVTIDSNGCVATDQVTVIINFENIVFVPNIFSPNGDGINDIVYVEGKTVESIDFFIYDRWGEKVFESTNQAVGWDGSYRGKPMNKAVFVYYLQATFKDGSTVTKKGDITLMR